eukprot:s2332_g13.t1
MDHGEDFAQVEAVFKARLEESQKTSVKYGFRNDQWLIKHHGQKKAERIMQRKKSLGLNLDFKKDSPFFTISPAQPLVPCLLKSLQSFAASSLLPRTMNDPEFPGEEEYLFFVLVEVNIEDVKELKRITQLELTGTLDPDGVKAFVEVNEITATAKERVDLAKALIRAVDKPKAKAKAEAKKAGEEQSNKTTGDETAAK